MDRWFRGIPLDRASVSDGINATATAILSMYLSRRPAAPHPLGQTIRTVQNALLKEYIARGPLYLSPGAIASNSSTACFSFCGRSVPSGTHDQHQAATT